MKDPVGAEYLCPYMNGQCNKQSHVLSGPYPVCSIRRKTNPALIAVCPKRFLEADLLKDVLEHCWPGDKPKNPRLAHEVSMEKFGKVDLVVADVDEATNSIREFVSVELQAVDITGSVEPAYSALLNSEKMVNVSYGVNWANVRKRYIDQLITKSNYHRLWGTRMIAVMQTPLFDYLRAHMHFDELAPDAHGIDVAFLLYRYKEGEGDESHTLVFDRVVRTSQSSLMFSALTQVAPAKSEFSKRILARLD